MTTELIIISVLSAALLVAVVLLFWRKPKIQTDEGMAKAVDLISQAVGKVQTEQSVAREVQRGLKDELRQTSDQLKGLLIASREREERDQLYFKNLLEASRNIESVMRGSKTKGMAGENIIREILKIFPPDTMVYDAKVGSKMVEFGLKLPDGRIVPIDSKILAVDELAGLEKSQDEAAKLKIIQKIELLVLRQAREVSEYISPPTTYEWAIMAVPDPLHYLLKDSVMRAYRDHHVIIIPYGMTVPYLLTFLDLHRKHATHLDEERVKAFLIDLGHSLSKMDDILDNKVAKGNVMIQNAYTEYKQMISKIKGDTLSVQATTVPALKGDNGQDD
ncbi:MAG: DNA recombination protein RmuC [Patescibacteria group bacterium]|nr:DNA recombination protein RmuC [Patescibacteria group bacterium]